MARGLHRYHSVANLLKTETNAGVVMESESPESDLQTNANHLSAVDLLSSLLRTEQLTVDTYQIIADKSQQHLQSEVLVRIRSDHEKAVGLLGELVQNRGGNSGKGSKGEDGVAALAASVGAPSQDPYAWKALKEREEENILNFELALSRTDLDAEVKQVISERLLPMVKRHIPVLNRLLNAA
jgi:hypothetical protein